MNDDLLSMSVDELKQQWRHYEFVLSQCVSTSDVYRQIGIENELVERGVTKDEFTEMHRQVDASVRFYEEQCRKEMAEQP